MTNRIRDYQDGKLGRTNESFFVQHPRVVQTGAQSGWEYFIGVPTSCL